MIAEQDPARSLSEIASLLDAAPQPGTPEGDRLAELLQCWPANRSTYAEAADRLGHDIEDLEAHIAAFERRRNEGRPVPGAAGEGAGFIFPG